MRAFFSLEYNARHQAGPSVPTRSFCESILFVRLEALRGSERRVVRIVGMVGLTLDETLSYKLRLETWSSFSYLVESYRGTWVVTSKPKKEEPFYF